MAMPHERLGEGVCVFLVTRESVPLGLAELQIFMEKAGLAKQKWPQHIELTEVLEKTASGKVRKDVLRQKVKVALASQQ